MPRPADSYAHSQFEQIDSSNIHDTVQCVHCRNWTGNLRTLKRKKEHLLRCPQYSEWRAAGNGQDLAPKNPYSKRDGSMLNAWDRGESDAKNPFRSSFGANQTTPLTARAKNIDLGKYFDEIYDDSAGQKSTRVRCLSCGFVRGKNGARQIEHLATCSTFLASSEGQATLRNGELEIGSGMTEIIGNRMSAGAQSGLDLHGGGRALPATWASGNRIPDPTPFQTPNRQPSLVSHLLVKAQVSIQKASQSDFLKHAGCGTLAPAALTQWLNQNGCVSRAMIPFIGTLIGKIRLPSARNSQQNGQYRTLDLLVSTVSNVRKELDFVETTKARYNIREDAVPASPITTAYVDLLASVSAANNSILLGMVVLWATEHLYVAAWTYARSFASTMPTSSTYSVPSYLTAGQRNFQHAGALPDSATENYTTAVQEAFIPNWTSPAFGNFVEACRAIVDELAVAQTTGSGIEELARCEQLFNQITWIWARMWPEVTGMGDLSELAESRAAVAASTPGIHGNGNGVSATDANGRDATGSKDHAIEIDDVNSEEDDEDDTDADVGMDPTDSPYGGTGLAAIAAANEAI